MMLNVFRRTNPDWHVADDDLLLYADGELSPNQSSKIHEHLESCWPCRVRAEKYSQIISELVDCVGSEVAASIPPPPNTWRYFVGQLNTASLQPRRWWPNLRFTVHLVGKQGVQLASLVLILLSGFFLLHVFRANPSGLSSTSPNDLLRRASAADLQRLRQVREPVVYQKLAIRADGRSLTREIWRDASTHRLKENWDVPARHDARQNAKPHANPVPPGAEEVKKAFVSNNFPWDDPLSADSYEAWRNTVALGSENVEHDGDHIVLRTSTLAPASQETAAPVGHARLVAARLTLRARDLHPISEILDFSSYTNGKENLERIELAELKYDVLPFSSLHSDLFSDAVSSPLIAGSLHSAVIHPPAGPSLAELIDSEMAARFALHKVGADLNSPITVVLQRPKEGAVVAIRGIMPSSSKQRELVEALSGIPFLSTQLKTEADVSQELPVETANARSEPGPPASAPPPPRSPIAKQLLRDLQSQEAVEMFSEQAFSSAESLMAHSWAWRRLSERYTELNATGPPLRPSSQQLVDTMLRDYREGMRTDATALLKTLEPVLISFAATPETASDKLSVFDRASRVQTLTLYLLFGTSAKESEIANPEEAGRELLDQLRFLCSELQGNDGV